jgi:ligand-binding sensor domain-containing protein/class 3 adenylate cyclase/predicted metal-dependent HD superfamily phosphohydrolase
MHAQNNLKFERYTINSGLSQSSVTSIVQDVNGFIWIGTQDGLNKFDGYEFTIYKSTGKENAVLSGNYINALFKSSENLIYIATSKGIDVYDPVLDKISPIAANSSSVSNQAITCIAEDRKRNLYIGTDGDGIYKLDHQTKMLTRFSMKSLNKNSSNNITSISALKDGSFLIGCSNFGVWQTDHFKQIKRLETQDYNEHVQFIEEIDETVYVGTNESIYTLYNNELVHFDKKLDSIHGKTTYTSIFRESEYKYWVGTETKGLIALNGLPRIREVKSYSYDHYQNFSLSDDKVNVIFKDRSGIIWIGTDQGISKFDVNKQGFELIAMSNSPQKGLVGLNPFSISESPDLSYYFIGTEKAVSRFNKETFNYEHFFIKNEDNHVFLSLFPESKDRIWVGSTHGLHLLSIDPENSENYTFKKVNHRSNQFDEKIYSIKHADSNHIWISTSSGISLININSNKFEHYNNENSGLGKGPFKAIYRSQNNKLYIATGDGGLMYPILLQDNSYDFKTILFNEELKRAVESYITSISETSSNEFWIGTYGSGLISFNPKNGSISSFNENNGLPNNVVYGILKDVNNLFWISTNRGITKFNPVKKTVTNYTEFDGLQSNEFNTGSYFLAKDGTMFFGGIKGLNHFHPENIKSNTTLPKVVFTELYINHELIKAGSENLPRHIASTSSITLDYTLNDIEIKFSAQHYSNPDKNQYKYILEGQDDAIIFNGNSNVAKYTDLRPGKYLLKVFASNSDGKWSSRPVKLEIIITPPFWETWWFRIVVTLFLILVVYIIIRARVEKVRRQQVRLEMQIAERTREIRQQNKQIEKQKKKVEQQNSKIEEQKALLVREKAKADELLLNILPEETAEELKNKGKYRARNYRNVSVMFTDFVGFTKIAENMTPSELVTRLDIHFKKFDEIIENLNLEKIKTIGDAYMCAGGVPIRNKSNPIETVLAGIQIQKYMLDNRIKREKRGEEAWKLRIGINSGEVVAGVIGLKRFAYDIWGVTVNQAQRMEMHGEANKVNIGGATFDLVEPYFVCTYRGQVRTKSKGLIDMYFVDRIKPELSEDEAGTIPNEKFWKIVDLHLYSSINYMKAERHIMNVLEEGLPDGLHYHCISHTVDVTQAVERLAISEGITDEDLFLLKSAATYHDAGFVEQYDANEPIGARLASEILPKYGYEQKQIDKITELIYATTIPHKPKNLMEQIICDADLDYLGRDDFHEIADRLRVELREHGKINSDRLWDEIQVKFLTAHKYFTETAISTRQAKKLKHIEEIKQRLIDYDYED